MSLSSPSLLPYVSLSSKKTGSLGIEEVKSNAGKDLITARETSGAIPDYQAKANLDLFLSLQTLQIRQFDVLFDPCPGFRVDSGQVWHQITPLMLGWMQRQVDQQLQKLEVDLQELGAALGLLCEALERSGLSPVAPPLSWLPPGYGLRFPDLDAVAAASTTLERPTRTRPGTDSVRLYAGVQRGSRVVLFDSVCTATGEIKAGTECVVVSAGLDEYGNQLLTLDSTTGRRLVCGVAADRVGSQCS